MRRRAKSHDNKHAGWLMLGVFAWSFCLGMGQVTRVEVVVGASLEAERFPGEVANFGNQEQGSLFVPNLNLMLPPENQTYLCDYPEEATPDYDFSLELNNTNSTPYMEYDSHLTSRDSMSVALFVSYGDCLPSQKAKVALELQRNFTQYGTVTHLVIYNNDYSRMDELHTLTTYINDEDMNSLSIIFVSTRTGRDVMEIIQDEELHHERLASPVFFAEDNEFWYLPVSFLESPPYLHYSDSGNGFNDIDPYSDNFDNHQYPPPMRQDTGMPDADDFYWFRLIVFSLLVVSPCFRAAYLWYAGGARIRFRYNEQGRIVGLQYIPPMPYWFSPRPDENYAQPPNRMTREQVLALPEIVFTAEATEDIEQPIDNIRETRCQHLSESSRKESTGNGANKVEGGPFDINANASTTTGSGTDSSGNYDEEQGPPFTPSELHSTCSICIDDFEQGERLRMLPRCRHIFHTDCILPWLTERQGCCPLCKTEVIEPPHADGSTAAGDNLSGSTPGLGTPQVSVEGEDVFINEDHHRQNADTDLDYSAQEQPLDQLATQDNPQPITFSQGDRTEPTADNHGSHVTDTVESDLNPGLDNGDTIFQNEYDQNQEGRQ